MKSVLKILPVAALALGLAFGGPAAAQQAAPPKPSAAAVASAKEILALRKISGMWASIVPEVVTGTKNALIQQHLTLQKDLTEVAPAVAQQLNGRELEVRDGIAELYASEFTEPELKELVAFYKSPLGQKLIDTEPKVVAQSIQFRRTWEIKFSETVLSAFRTELKKRGKDL